jgi:hypothetical protein
LANDKLIIARGLNSDDFLYGRERFDSRKKAVATRQTV